MTRSFVGVATRLPAQDLDRARQWYDEKLGLRPVEERPGGLRYVIGSGEFCVFHSAGTSSGAFTQLAITVDDIVRTMADLRSRGVVFLEYNAPPLVTADGLVRVEGNYASKGGAELGCWFIDSEGNLISLGQSLPN